MKKQKQIKISSSALEDFIWMSYRYCIGRHTIAAAMHADTIWDIIHKNPDCLSEERKAFMAKDIRNNINTILGWRNNIDVIGHENFDVYSKYLYEVSKCDNPNEFCFHIDTIRDNVTIDKLDEDEISDCKCDNDYPDLIRWTRLANYLDIKYHKIVVTNYDGKIEEYECYSYPMYVTDDNHMIIPNKYRKVWTTIDTPLSQNRHIAEEYIIDIKDLD